MFEKHGKVHSLFFFPCVPHRVSFQCLLIIISSRLASKTFTPDTYQNKNRVQAVWRIFVTKQRLGCILPTQSTLLTPYHSNKEYKEYFYWTSLNLFIKKLTVALVIISINRIHNTFATPLSHCQNKLIIRNN